MKNPSRKSNAILCAVMFVANSGALMDLSMLSGASDWSPSRR